MTAWLSSCFLEATGLPSTEALFNHRLLMESPARTSVLRGEEMSPDALRGLSFFFFSLEAKMVLTGWWLRKRLGSKGIFGLVVSLMWETKVFLSKVRKVHSPVYAVGA